MSAIELLTKAIDLDVEGRRVEALKLYEDGISELLRVCKEEQNEQKKKHYQVKIMEYMDRAEKVKALIQTSQTKGEIADKIHIIDGATGYGYGRVFGRYMDDKVREIRVEEPYLKEHFQICELVMFCELAISKCRNLKAIRVITTQDPQKQAVPFKSLADSLEKKLVRISFEYSNNLHDRQVILSNGYIVKVGRGLHYFKPPTSKYAIGAFNYDLRECRETNIDILYSPENNKAS